MSRWYNRAAPPNVIYVGGRFGDAVAYRDIPNELKLPAVADFFGATTEITTDSGVVICGSLGEVANDPTLREIFDVRSNELRITSVDMYHYRKYVQRICFFPNEKAAL